MRAPISLIILFAWAIIVGDLSAQNKRMGTAAATELLVPVGARDFAMGGATVATSEGVEAIYWNPAAMGGMRSSVQAMFSSMAYIADVNVNYGAIAASFGGVGVVALSVKSIDFGDIPLTTNDDPEGVGGRLFSPQFVTVAATYARSLTEAINAGVSMKIVAEDIDRVFATGVAFDLGVQYKNLGGVPGFHLGVSVKNIGPQMKFDGPGMLGPATRSDGLRPEQKYSSQAGSFQLPSSFDFGLAYESHLTDNLMGTASGSYSNRNLGLDEFRAGGELAYTLDVIRLFGRLGTDFVPQAQTDEQHIFGSTYGFGIVYNTEGIDIVVDFAYRSARFFGGNSVFSLKFGF